MKYFQRRVVAVALGAVLCGCRAREECEQLAKLAQNPVGNLISVRPEQHQPERRAGQSNAEHPRHPAGDSGLGERQWNIITRTIVPVISQPLPDGERKRYWRYGIHCLLSPAKPGSLHLGCRASGAGADQQQLGPRQPDWGLGPAVWCSTWRKVIPGFWVLWLTIRLVSDSGTGGSYNNATIQPCQLQLRRRLLHHQRPDHHRQLEGREQPAVDGAVRRWRRQDLGLGKLPVNTQLSAYYNVVTPDDGANWQIRAQVQLMFPK